MHMKRMLSVGLLGILAALAFAVPAGASNFKVVCVVNGEAKVTDKAHPGGVQLVSGGGTYTFNQLDFTCAGTAKGAPYTETAPLTSQGKFSNVVCGTGTAVSNVGQTTSTGTGKLAAQAKFLAYKVQFVGTVGTIHVNNVAPKDAVPKVAEPPTPLTDKPTTNPAGLHPAGVVNLLPPTTKPVTVPTPPACTKAFRVVGTVEVDR